MSIHKFVESIWVFCSEMPEPECVWCTMDPTPQGVTPLVYLVDVSGSMNAHVRELREASAAFLEGSNVTGNWQIPMLKSRTNLVYSVASMKNSGYLTGKDLVVFTDGAENTITSCLAMNGKSYDFEGGCQAMGTETYLGRVAQFLVEACDANLYLIGLGNDAKIMEGHLVKRRNVYVAHVDSGATSESIIATVRTVMSRGRSRATEVQTENPESTEAQQEVIVALSEEVQEMLRSLDQNDVRTIVAASNNVIVGVSLKGQIETQEVYVNTKVPGTNVMFNRAVLLLLLRCMAEDDPIPPSIFYSKHSPVFAEDDRLNKQWINTMLAKLASAKPGVVSAGPKTPAEGLIVKVFDGVERKSAPKAATYKSSVNVHELEALAAPGDWCFPLTEVKLRAPKRPRLV